MMNYDSIRDALLAAPKVRVTGARTKPALSAVPDGAVEPFLPLPTAFTGRHLWFVLWLAWFIHGLWRSRAHQPNQRR